MLTNEIIRILNGQYVLVEREELESWMVDVRAAHEWSYDDDYTILERLLTKIQNQLNSQMKEIKTIETNASGETKYG